MGVKGLWSLVSHTGTPVRLETLTSKTLAIDASIWLHQFLKAMRGKDGSPLPGGHLTGFFHRIAKLLFYGIRPVFVYDGVAPGLKRATLVRDFVCVGRSVHLNSTYVVERSTESQGRVQRVGKEHGSEIITNAIETRCC